LIIDSSKTLKIYEYSRRIAIRNAKKENPISAFLAS